MTVANQLPPNQFSKRRMLAKVVTGLSIEEGAWDVRPRSMSMHD